MLRNWFGKKKPPVEEKSIKLGFQLHESGNITIFYAWPKVTNTDEAVVVVQKLVGLVGLVTNMNSNIAPHIVETLRNLQTDKLNKMIADAVVEQIERSKKDNFILPINTFRLGNK